MKAIILAGGLGTRLKPLTEEIPKPLVPIIDKPVIVHIIELLRSHGITEIAVAVGYLSDKIVHALGDGSKFGVKLTYFLEREPLGTAGCVKAARRFFDGDFVTIAGDAYTDVDLTAAIDFHRNRKSLFTLVAKEVPDPTGFGVMKVDGNGKVTEFIEKPKNSDSNLVNTGIYIIDKTVLSLVPEGKYDFGKQLLPRLIGNLYAYKTDAYWSDIGTLPSYYMTNYLVACAMEREA